MTDFPTVLHYIILTAYYLLVGVIGLLSLFGIYVLVSYGRSRIVVMVISTIYIVAFLSLIGASQITLQSL